MIKYEISVKMAFLPITFLIDKSILGHQYSYICHTNNNRIIF